MPQLNPAPWFFTFMLVWSILLLLLKPTLMELKSTHQPQPHTMKHTLTPWAWTWH
ncbi:ATP synthase F0 subunit 8 (mitochondrion) [Heteronotia binoei]|uniref:ATP synthase complex subunit 8 n=1 Tax=Heteronotia binoei TaxID=13085 RepID=A9XSF3_9SAUR|nr:ATP synthase F0 subunit 8 [Heteronotia binoei]ABR21256.1 ATP synthase F0 subunit 8 [Heteronotia binoei]ABR21269.1 ATP synthase F0 subunit 8 [Heteronotia binoei]ABR21282.1 ATP synthase F0 subunit 8 [Heteronotia binoei]ABR21295.1 ATP synthase F0 subunit 8 [Heteronotia binoei]ABR21322.1 ATP synthase F0 subunit 8 [Heteronotia binoei]